MNGKSEINTLLADHVQRFALCAFALPQCPNAPLNGVATPVLSKLEICRNSGMNAPEAAQNHQFLVNVMHWLTRLKGMRD